MASLKKDLDEYLLLQSDQKKSFKLQLPIIQTSSATNWFKDLQQSSQSDENGSWFQETKTTCSQCCPTLSRFQRILFFGISIIMGCICFSLSLMYIPMLLFKARKFSLLFTLGSLFFILSFIFLWGPLVYVKHMFSKDKLLLTATYGSTLFATLYCALHLQSTPLTVLSAVGQIVTLLWTVIANIPGGTSGITFFSKIFNKSVNTLPI